MANVKLRKWFKQRGWKPFPFQEETWQAFFEGKSGLLHAPTGVGKTWAAYLGPLMMTDPKVGGLQILWITPLRALAADTLRTLREPLQDFFPKFEAEARTGDSSASLRARLRKNLPHTLVTTPESLSLMLTHADFREKIANLRGIIVDEWHELLGTKRGVQTELCLARLRTWQPNVRIWGLSATLGNLTEARRSLLGSAFSESVKISADLKRTISLETCIPKEMSRFPWAGHIGTQLASQVVTCIEKAQATLLFTNTRSQTEIWFQQILAIRPDWKSLIAMHHGSLDRADRELAEAGLRDGSLKCVVATSSLDLGVDFSPVDQVIQIGSPKGIARLMQRAGRSGHQPNRTSSILCVPTHALELIEFAAARDAMKSGEIESRRLIKCPLDVLVQHLVTCAIGEPFAPAEMRAEVQSAWAYENLSDADWAWAMGFITDGGQALKSYPKYRKVSEMQGRYGVEDKRLIAQHRMSIGTIVSEPSVSVQFASGRSLGTIEESFVAKLKPGSRFIFSGKALILVRLHQRKATVKVAPKMGTGAVAIWGGSRMPLSTELADAMARRLGGLEDQDGPEMSAVQPLLGVQRQWSQVPGTERLLIEFTRSREGEHWFIYPFAGRLVHEGLSALCAFRLAREIGESIQTTQNDYGFSLTARRGLSLSEEYVALALTAENFYEDLIECMNSAELARRQFREIARVSGLVLQPPPNQRDRGQRDLQVSSSLLFEVLNRYDPENLLLVQAQREILEKQLEMTRLSEIIKRCEAMPKALIETEHLTPFAFPLWAERLTALMPAGDAESRLEAMLRELTRAATNLA